MDDAQIPFFQFHAINEFMNNEFRQRVVREALQALPSLPEEHRAPIERLTRQVVKVPGFRNSAKAPVQKRLKPTIDAFEKSPELVAALLSAWAETHPELRQQVFALLQERGWDLLPPEADRTQLPGFMTVWPKNEDFEVLNNAFKELHPGQETPEDDVSLMVVWLSMRLPYEQEGDEQEEEEDPAA